MKKTKAFGPLDNAQMDAVLSHVGARQRADYNGMDVLPFCRDGGEIGGRAYIWPADRRLLGLIVEALRVFEVNKGRARVVEGYEARFLEGAKLLARGVEPPKCKGPWRGVARSKVAFFARREDAEASEAACARAERSRPARGALSKASRSVRERAMTELVAKGDKSLAAKRFDAALRYFEEAMKIVPERELHPPHLHARVAECLTKLGRPGDARALLEQDVAIHSQEINADRRDADAWFRRGIAHGALGEASKLRRDLQTAVRIDDAYEADALAYLGDEALLHGDGERAAGAARHRALVFSEVPELSFYLGRVIESSFFIPRRSIESARRRLLDEDAEMSPRWTLEKRFEAAYANVRKNSKGDLVGIEMGGDVWPVDLLGWIAEHVREGSYFLIEDDRGGRWRIEFTGGRLRTLRSRASKRRTR